MSQSALFCLEQGFRTNQSLRERRTESQCRFAAGTDLAGRVTQLQLDGDHVRPTQVR
jgi:hypothetical protein